MIIEVDSREIIAYEIERKKDLNVIKLSFVEIKHIADKLEELNTQIHSCGDLISIDAFRCAFPSYVRMDDNFLIIENINELRHFTNRLLPNEMVYELLNEILKK